MKVRDRLKRRAYSRHALLRTWDVEVRRDIRRQIREFEDRQDAGKKPAPISERME